MNSNYQTNQNNQINKNNPKKIVIVGGVAGGASCAARLRRLNEHAQIIMVERGPYISFANCGLPYHISGTIAKRESLIVTSVDGFTTRFNVDTRPNTEAVSINRNQKTIQLKNTQTGEVKIESYDALVLSPGADPIRPPISGNDLDGVYVLRNIPDLDKIMSQLNQTNTKHVTVIGAGFIGVETVENLQERGFKVTLVEKAPQVMPLLDPEVSAFIQKELTNHGIQVLTGSEITKIEKNQPSSAGTHQFVLTDDKNQKYNTDLVLFSVGVRPEVSLAKAAGLTIGVTGGISVNSQLQTSDPNIFAVGDAIEFVDKKLGVPVRIPLAGPANRQGRLVADIIQGSKEEYRTPNGASIVKAFNMVAASVGMTEKGAQRYKQNYQAVWVESKSHAGYYPGAEPVLLKLLFDPNNGRILGAQSVGKKGIDKRIDVISTAIYAGLTVYDLENLDLAYAPPFSSAKDPVNMIGMVASGILRGDHPVARFEDVPRELAQGESVLVDVREASEFARGSVPGAISMPLTTLRKNLQQLPKNKKLLVYCQAGYRAYLATRILIQNDFKAVNVMGGYSLWSQGGFNK